MSDPIDTGGMAFPGLEGTDGHGCSRINSMPDGAIMWEYHSQGMTLRDHFAGQALGGLLKGVETPNYEAAAKIAYRMADAMIAARKEQS
jgi:hypothetical protein